MKILGSLVLSLAMFASTVGATGCVETSTVAPSMLSSIDAREASGGASAASGADVMAADAIACVLRDGAVDRARCEAIARVAGSSLTALLRADHDAVDRLGEALGRRARSERMTPAQRVGMARWLDLGLAAAREAAIALDAARAANLTSARRDVERSGDLDAIEAAGHLDATSVRSRSHLDALRRFALEGLDGAREAEAIAVVIAHARLGSARDADASVRADAMQTALDVAVDVAGPGSVEASPTTVAETSARSRAGRDEATSIEAARQRLVVRGGAACPRAEGAIRSLCERSVR
jgi:hypothetical protein